MDPIITLVMAVFLSVAVTLFLLVVVLLWTVLVACRILTGYAEEKGYDVVASPFLEKEKIKTGPRKKFSKEGDIARPQDLVPTPEAEQEEWQALYNI